MHKKNPQNQKTLARLCGQNFTSFFRVSLIPKSLLVHAVDIHGKVQNSHQEERNQTVFFGTSSRTRLSADSLFSWSCTGRSALQPLLLFINCPIWWGPHPQRGTQTQHQHFQGSPEPPSAPQWGRASTFNTGLDFCNPPGSKAPICLSTVNPHVLSVSLAFYFGKTK